MDEDRSQRGKYVGVGIYSNWPKLDLAVEKAILVSAFVLYKASRNRYLDFALGLPLTALVRVGDLIENAFVEPMRKASSMNRARDHRSIEKVFD